MLQHTLAGLHVDERLPQINLIAARRHGTGVVEPLTGIYVTDHIIIHLGRGATSGHVLRPNEIQRPLHAHRILVSPRSLLAARSRAGVVEVNALDTGLIGIGIRLGSTALGDGQRFVDESAAEIVVLRFDHQHASGERVEIGMLPGGDSAGISHLEEGVVIPVRLELGEGGRATVAGSGQRQPVGLRVAGAIEHQRHAVIGERYVIGRFERHDGARR